MLEQRTDLKCPPAARGDGVRCKHVSDTRHKELKAAEVNEVFETTFIKPRGIFDLGEVHFRQEDGFVAEIE